MKKFIKIVIFLLMVVGNTQIKADNVWVNGNDTIDAFSVPAGSSFHICYHPGDMIYFKAGPNNMSCDWWFPKGLFQGYIVTYDKVYQNNYDNYYIGCYRADGAGTNIYIYFDTPPTRTQSIDLCSGQSLTVGSHTYNTSGTYIDTIPATNSCDTIVTTILTVNPLPIIPIITQNGNTLLSSSATNNQWYLNGNLISGASAQTYTPTVSGNYKVYVTNTFGCTSHSVNFYFILVTGYTVSGTIKYNNTSNTPLSSVVVNLMNGTTQIGAVTTDVSGNYSISNVPDGTYIIVPVTTKAWGGVTSTDVLKLRRHIAGLELLTEPIRLTAADANASVTLTSTDVLKMQRRIAGLDNSFTQGDWVFEKPVTGGKTITVNGTNITQDFYGLCVGDVNGSNNPAK